MAPVASAGFSWWLLQRALTPAPERRGSLGHSLGAPQMLGSSHVGNHPSPRARIAPDMLPVRLGRTRVAS